MKRERLSEAYIRAAVDTLVRTRGVDPSRAEEFCRTVSNNNFRDLTALTQHCPSSGSMVVKKTGLFDLIDKHRDDIISPSGSIYMAEAKKRSVISKMVEEQMAERKRCKKNMYIAKDAGDDVTFNLWYLRQAVIKIMMNSLPGGFASAYNVFYDKGGYNTITSFGRTVISTAYTIAEQLFCGVFALFDDESTVTHLTNILMDKPSDEQIFSIIRKFRLMIPTKEMLLAFFYDTVSQYQKRGYKLSLTEDLVNNMSEAEVCYAYYYGNLKHILMMNERVARNWIASCLSFDDIVSDPTVDKAAVIDEEIIAFVNPLIHERLDDRDPYELLEDSDAKSLWFATVLQEINKRLNKWMPVFETFVFRNCGIPNRNKTKYCIRRSVIISDTDSVIYTAKPWTEWYTGKLAVTHEAYGVALFMTYWLSKAHAHALYNFSRNMGADDKRLKLLKMKNEFLYPSLILFDIKKMYAGIVSIQEGLVLKDPEIDIKGVQLRSSNTAKETTDFVNNFIENDVLKASMVGKLDPRKLVARIMELENKIRRSLDNGEMEYLRVDSLDYESAYKNPMSTSQFVSWKYWTEVFRDKYGEIHPPGKYPVVPLISMTSEEQKYYAERFPEIYGRMVEFEKKYKKSPNFLMINPLAQKIPEEIQPLVDIRSILYHNLKPVFLIMTQLGLGVGFEKNKLLYSDIYPAETYARTETANVVA